MMAPGSQARDTFRLGLTMLGLLALAVCPPVAAAESTNDRSNATSGSAMAMVSSSPAKA